MHGFHSDKRRYFQMQYECSRDYILPFLEGHVDLSEPKDILEIGCAEAGVLKAFTEKGHRCLGIELSPSRVELARKFMAEEIAAGKVEFMTKDIYDIEVNKDIGHRFDVVILKDVIEHIYDQAKFIARLDAYLKPGGIVYFGFPPWYMPFGGHQQTATKKILMAPYYHILPKPIYKGILSLFGEKKRRIEDLMEIKDTAISIERFERIVKKENFSIDKRQFYLINPIYKHKFNLKPRKQFGFLGAIPFFRNFVTTCVYYIISKK